MEAAGSGPRPGLCWSLADDHKIGVRESLLLSAGHISAALIFRFFDIPRQYQQCVLFWAAVGEAYLALWMYRI